MPRDAEPGGARRRPLAKAGIALGAVAVLVLAGVLWRTLGPGSPKAAEEPPTSTRPAGTQVSGSRHATNEQAVALVRRGNELLRQGSAAEAVRAYTDAEQLAPEDEDIPYNLGIALARLGRDDDAIAAYRRALGLFPTYAEAHNNLGNLLHRQGKLDEAIQHFQTAIDSMPDYASAHNNLGNVFRQQGRLPEATREFLAASTIDTNYWQAHFNLGNIYLAQERVNEAVSSYETVLRLKPDFTPAREALDRAVRSQGPVRP